MSQLNLIEHAAEIVLALVLVSAVLIFVRRSRAALERKEAYLRMILDNAADCIITINENGIIEVFNAAAERLFGYRAADVVGRNVSTLMPEPHRSRHDGYIERYKRTGEKRVVDIAREVEGRHRDGSFFPIHLAVGEAFLGGRRVFIGILHDLTEARQAEKRLRRALEEAQEVSRGKSELLANLSHELRTPLNSIMGMNYLLQQTAVSGQQSRYLKQQEQSAGNLKRSVDDILDFAKIEMGTLTLEASRFVLDELLARVTDWASPRARQKGLAFNVVKGVDIPSQVVGDPQRLEKILRHLIENAVKFTESGEIALSVALTGQDDFDVGLRFSVTDTGIGIGREQLDHMFQAFTQMDSSSTRKEGGLGIGLSICKQLVSLMDGAIEVRSESGVGSTFSFTAKFGLHAASFAQAAKKPSPKRGEPVGSVDSCRAFEPGKQDLEDLMSQLEELAGFLRRNDMQAEPAFAALKTTLASIMPEQTNELARKLDIFDFRGASEQLAMIAAALEDRSGKGGGYAE